MDTIIGLIQLFTFIAPIYVGATTFLCFCTKKSEPTVEKTKPCREPKFLIICILLLLLIPFDLIYITLAKNIPDGHYVMSAEYSVYACGEVYDEDKHEYIEKEYSYKGIAPITIEVTSGVDYEENGETFWGETITKSNYYINYCLSSIKLDCFNNAEFILDEEIEQNQKREFEIEHDGNNWSLSIEIGEISDETLGYTIEDRISGVSTRTIVEHIILMALDVIGIIGYFIAMKIYRNNENKGDD